jgi:long-chain acyl-CoA synthetase
VLLPESLTPDSGLLTPTGKARRSLVARRYASLIDALYAGADSVQVPGSDGAMVELKLWDAQASGAAKGRAAA